MDIEHPSKSDFWSQFLEELGKKTKSHSSQPKKIAIALNNALSRPKIYLAFGIHGNILYPDVGYCEFDDPEKAWEHIQRWAKFDGFPVGFEVGMVSLEELGHRHPVWETLRNANATIINPLYGEPYLRHIGEAASLRQFEVGLDILQANGLGCPVFASSEHALHPQLPQLLKIFHIPSAYVTCRLAGGAPTAYLPKIEWQGLDGSVVPAIISQSGIPNGHIWHGKFFEELPGLIFAAVARPDLPYAVYTNIEDFANPMPGHEEVAAHISEFEKANIYFCGFDELVANELPISRKVCWGLEDFPIRFMRSIAIAPVHEAEDILTQVEAIDILLESLGGQSHPTEIEKAWRQLLTAQNHDAYIVPFTTPGMYSQLQGLEETKKWESNETMEQRSANIAGEVVDTAFRIIESKDPTNLIAINWLWARDVPINGKLYRLPAMGYTNEAEEWIAPHNFKLVPEGIEYFGLHISINQEWHPLSDSTHPERGMLNGKDWQLSIMDIGKWLQIRVETKVNIELILGFRGELYCSYPFGAEKTTELQGHASRFLWDDHGYLYAHTGCPYFSRSPKGIHILIPEGEHTMMVAKAPTLVDAYRLVWEFAYPPIMASSLPSMPKKGSFIPDGVDFQGSIPIQLRRTVFEPVLTVLSIDGSVPMIPHASCCDYAGHPVDSSLEPGPWSILHYALSLKDIFEKFPPRQKK